jgi:hypothetical protein
MKSSLDVILAKQTHPKGTCAYYVTASCRTKRPSRPLPLTRFVGVRSATSHSTFLLNHVTISRYSTCRPCSVPTGPFTRASAFSESAGERPSASPWLGRSAYIRPYILAVAPGLTWAHTHRYTQAHMSFALTTYLQTLRCSVAAESFGRLVSPKTRRYGETILFSAREGGSSTTSKDQVST